MFRLRLSPLRILGRRSMSLRIRPTDWKVAAPELPGETFHAQSQLLKLPVPNLSHTLVRLKESLRPIAFSDVEYSEVVKKVDEFATHAGPILQNRLLDHAKHRSHWLEEWWDDGGYLGYRDSVVVNVSYYYGFDNPPSNLSLNPVSRAASIARAAMIFRSQLKKGLIKPEATKEGPLCMDTYRWMFDCCRIPGESLDWSVSYAKPLDLGDSGHIIAIRKNRVWKIDITKNGRILCTEEIEKQLQHIYDNSLHEYPGVGVLTASNRDVWAKDYVELASNSHNAKILEELHSSAFVLSLETSRPSDAVQFSRGLWHGDIVNHMPVGLRNRWVDKPVQFIVYDNGMAGIMGEHSVMDGTPTARMCHDVLDMLYSPTFDHGVKSGDLTPIPTPLDWKVSPTIEKAIVKADRAAADLIEGQELGYHLTSYGKAAIKKFGVSPDSWAQMVIQLGFRRLLGDKQRGGGTYEAASTRRFFKGRTETIRVVSNESDAWVKSMDDKTCTLALRKQLFDDAAKKHIALAKAAGQGQGVDRHLFGLKNLLKQGEEIPELFKDPVFRRSSHWVLSTSAIFSNHFPVYGWGEVVPDGFGVAYMTGYEDRLQFTVTSRKELQNARFVQEIAKAAEDLYTLHQRIAHPTAKL